MQVVARLRPHTLVLNSGLWRSADDPAWPKPVYDWIFKAANAVVARQVRRACLCLPTGASQPCVLAGGGPAVLLRLRRCSAAQPVGPLAVLLLLLLQGGRCIWKTTSYGQLHQVGRERDEEPVAAARRHGWHLMDAWAATRAAKLQLPEDPFVDQVRVCGQLRCGCMLPHLAALHCTACS